MPISRTSFERLSLPASDWSIFRCAIERTSSRLVVTPRAARSPSRRRRRPGSCRAPSRSSSRPRRRRRARAGSRRARGPWAIPIETEILPARSRSTASSRFTSRVASATACSSWLAGEDHGELLAADPADDVARADGGAQMVGELGQHLVADRVAEDVVHLLEVVDVEHHERRRSRARSPPGSARGEGARGSGGGCRGR